MTCLFPGSMAWQPKPGLLSGLSLDKPVVFRPGYMPGLEYLVGFFIYHSHVMGRGFLVGVEAFVALWPLR